MNGSPKSIVTCGEALSTKACSSGVVEVPHDGLGAMPRRQTHSPLRGISGRPCTWKTTSSLLEPKVLSISVTSMPAGHGTARRLQVKEHLINHRLLPADIARVAPASRPARHAPPNTTRFLQGICTSMIMHVRHHAAPKRRSISFYLSKTRV